VLSRPRGVTVNYTVNIDAQGADKMGLARVEVAIGEDRATLPQRIVETVRDAQSRGATWV
jgi:hypothetical protein